MPRWLKIALGAVVVLLLAGGAALLLMSDPRPTGRAGPAAEALAKALEASVDNAAWQRTGAIRWNFDDRHRLLWDRDRSLVEVRWDALRVLRHVGDEGGALAYRDGTLLQGEPRAAAVKKAYALWANDSFWLNPLEKLFDAGVRRELWEGPDGERGLLVHYQSGGVTPGDSYLWLPGPDGRPRAWRMWVKIIPVGGLRASWEGWKQLSTGAWVSTLHDIAGKKLRLKDVQAAATLLELTGGDDPFAPLLAKQ